MKAVRLHRQGGPEQLVYEDAPEPELGAGDALIRVLATGITPAELTWAETYRNCDGSERLPAIPGHEVSGVVESVADGVSDVSIGDEVYALTSFCRDGAAAEYVAVHAADLAPKPKTLTHVQAAAVPLSALTVWQAFFEHAQLAPGQRVLIHGAAGGVGAFAVQTARWHGAYVIGTASAENRNFLLDLGANEVIDYQHVRFEEAVRDVDVVLDTIGDGTRERSWQVLKPGGILVSLPEPIPKGEAEAHGQRGVFFIVRPDREQLGRLATLIDSGAVRPVIAQTVPLAEAREAFERGVAGHTRGKLVLAVDKPSPSAQAASQFNQHEQETTMSKSYSLPTEPEGVVPSLIERFNSGKFSAMETLYEGAVVIADDGRTVTDHAEIAKELERDLSLGLPLEAKARHVFVNGDIAQIVVDWSIDGTGPNGKHVHVEGTASDVARRGADGRWRYLIDNRLGTAVRQPA